jgi:hypothetical protein
MALLQAAVATVIENIYTEKKARNIKTARI